MNKKVVAIIIVLCAFAFSLWYSSYREETRVKAQMKKDIAAARLTAQNYYDAYHECNTNPPSQAEGQVSNWCQENNPYGTQALVQELVQNGKIPFGLEPVLCAQNTPLSTRVEKTTGTIQDGFVKVVVVEDFGDSNLVKIQVEVVQEGDIWKVNKIVCPPPEA